jgi:serine/threonine protein phosphatase PrpC
MEFFKVGFDTDIGSSRINQDRCFIWRDDVNQFYVFGVADGHGKFGELAAETVRTSIIEYLDTNHNDLNGDVPDFLEKCFELFHNNIKTVFEEHTMSSVFSNNKTGGTTLSMVVIVKTKMFIANVADSSVLLCTKPSLSVLNRSLIKYERDCASSDILLQSAFTGELSSSALELTCTHSPDSLREFDRLRKKNPSKKNPQFPELLCLYDNQGLVKQECKPIFTISAESGIPIKENNGVYHKNVAKEWATIVADPISGYIAFTRSLGDFHFNDLGVSEKPEIQSIDLNEVAQCLSEEDRQICIVAATDGVWDNWTNDHICKFVMDPSCLNAIATQPDIGALRVAKSLIRRNSTFAKRHFGENNTDNATVIVAYIDLRMLMTPLNK